MNEGTLGCLSLFVPILLSIGAGWFAWEKVHPHTFWGFIGFLIVWSICTYLFKNIFVFIVGLLIAIFNKD